MIDAIADAYDELTVDDVKQRVRDHGGDVETIDAVADYERQRKARVTLLDWLEERRAHLAAVGDGPDPHPIVRVRPVGKGYVAGHWFDEIETREVSRTPRVDDALDAGRLRLLGVVDE